MHHHRDLAARNVLVTGQGVAKVIAPIFGEINFLPGGRFWLGEGS